MHIFTRCIHCFMSNLIKKSWTDSNIHQASWQEARKAIHSSNLLLVSSCWEKREKIGRKNHETKCFFAVKPVQIIWEVLTPPKVFRMRANSKSKTLTRQLSLNFHKSSFEWFLNIDLRVLFIWRACCNQMFANILSFSPNLKNQMKNWWDWNSFLPPSWKPT